MNQNWKNFLASRSARFENDEVCDFGEAQTELKAAASDTVLSPLSQFGLIRASGEDAASFLHNLFSNDVLHLGRERAERCGFCSPKGRLLADFLIWRQENDYLLQLSADIHPAILKRLGMYVLRSKVKLADAGEDLVLLGVAGNGAATALKALAAEIPAAPLGTKHIDEGTIIRLDEQRYLLAVRLEAASSLWDRLAVQLRPVGAPVWRWLEIEAGIPHITLPTQDEFVPQMANLELLGGVSFTKGCYPGQEVVARTRYLGKVKRRTYLAHVDGGCPLPGADLFSPDLPDQSCGKVIEAAPSPAGGCEILASMLISSAETGEVRVGGVEGLRLTLRSLPYPLE